MSVPYTFAANNADSLGVPLDAPGAGTPFSADRQCVAGCVEGCSQKHPRSPSPSAQAVTFTCDAGYYGWDPQQGMAYQVFEPENAGGMTAAAQVALAAPGEYVPPGDMTISVTFTNGQAASGTFTANQVANSDTVNMVITDPASAGAASCKATEAKP